MIFHRIDFIRSLHFEKDFTHVNELVNHFMCFSIAHIYVFEAQVCLHTARIRLNSVDFIHSYIRCDCIWFVYLYCIICISIPYYAIVALPISTIHIISYLCLARCGGNQRSTTKTPNNNKNTQNE